MRQEPRPEMADSALDASALAALLESVKRFEGPVPPLVKGIADAELHRVARFLRQLADGEAAYDDGEDRDWMLSLARTSTASIDATSTLVVDGLERGFKGGFWTGDLGHRYLRAQTDAVRRGVTVRRLFILDSTADAGRPEFLSICRSQTAADIQVRVTDRESVPLTLRSSLIDFVVFDRAASYELIPAPSHSGAPTFLSTRIIRRAEHLKARIAQFETLWTLGAPPA
ncbi:hypothetical protein [Actinocorallia longicatena]|uniref:Uncharacterized protein n=1 Tax=Actinocorallia longicatena TaxID=111803 RepID=A0ABP6Q4Q4_9ACTN